MADFAVWGQACEGALWKPGTFMRAPGVAPGMFALESAMDELAVKLGVDPVALRLRNYATA